MHTMHTDERKPVDKNYTLILIGYRTICLFDLPALGAGSRSPPQNRRVKHASKEACAPQAHSNPLAPTNLPFKTAYLLQSPKNTRRLTESIAQLENNKGSKKELLE